MSVTTIVRPTERDRLGRLGRNPIGLARAAAWQPIRQSSEQATTVSSSLRRSAETKIDGRLIELLGIVEPWVFHDIRRTVATGMADLAVAPHVLDRILNHVSGTITGAAAIYNRHQYLPERKAALDAWGRYLELLVYPGRAQANVVAMRGR